MRDIYEFESLVPTTPPPAPQLELDLRPPSFPVTTWHRDLGATDPKAPLPELGAFNCDWGLGAKPVTRHVWETWCIGSLKGYFCKQCHHTGPRTVREDPGLSYSNAVSRTVVYPSTTHPTAAARPRATGRSSRCTSACSGRWLKMSYGTGSISRLQPVSKTVTRIGVGWGLMGRRNRSKPLFGSAQPNCRSWDGVLRRCPGLEDQNQGDAGEDLVEVRASRRRCQPVAKTAA